MEFLSKLASKSAFFLLEQFDEIEKAFPSRSDSLFQAIFQPFSENATEVSCSFELHLTLLISTTDSEIFDKPTQCMDHFLWKTADSTRLPVIDSINHDLSGY